MAATATRRSRDASHRLIGLPDLKSVTSALPASACYLPLTPSCGRTSTRVSLSRLIGTGTAQTE